MRVYSQRQLKLIDTAVIQTRGWGKKELWKLGLGWRPEKKLKEEQHFWGKGELEEWSFEIPVFPASPASRRIWRSLASWGTKQSLKLSALLWFPGCPALVYTQTSLWLAPGLNLVKERFSRELGRAAPSIDPWIARNHRVWVLSWGGSPGRALGKAEPCCSSAAPTGSELNLLWLSELCPFSWPCSKRCTSPACCKELSYQREWIFQAGAVIHPSLAAATTTRRWQQKMPKSCWGTQLCSKCLRGLPESLQ